MREFSSLFAGYKNVTHDVGGCIYAERSGSVGVIISILSSVTGALMVETPQSVPTAPSMHKHTMRVVLVMECEFRFLWIPTRAFPCRCNTKRCLPIPSIEIYDTIILDNYANKSFTYIGSFAKISNHLLIIPAIIS